MISIVTVVSVCALRQSWNRRVVVSLRVAEEESRTRDADDAAGSHENPDQVFDGHALPVKRQRKERNEDHPRYVESRVITFRAKDGTGRTL